MKKIIKLLFKIAVILIGLVIILFFAIYITYNTPLPKGKLGKDADLLAFNITKNLGYEAYQNTDFISWKAKNVTYIWNKKEKEVTIKWADNHIIYNQNSPHKSIVHTPENISIQKKQKLIYTAEDKFNNDSFWLVAPYKFFDQGVERRYIKPTKNENASLLITYKSGGSTPGDSYQWFVDESFTPTHYKMWAEIIPINGLPATWSDWKKTETGAIIAHEKKVLGKITLPISQIKTWNSDKQ